MDEHKPK
jgi:hypothetical protein